MIQINLLPKELRKAEPTPWPKLLGLLVSLILILGVGLLMMYYRYTILPTVMDQRQRAEEETKGLEARAKEADSLEKEIKDFETREKTILQIRQTRWLWSKKLDQIIDMIPSYVQINSLVIKEARSGARGKEEEGPGIEMECLSQGTDERNIAKFRRKIMTSPFWEDVLDMPEWPYSVGSSAGKEKETCLKFRAVFTLRAKKPPPAQPPKAPAAPPRPPAPS